MYAGKVLLDFLLTEKAATLIFISGCGSAISSAIIALKASGRDCTNNNELLHKIGVSQRYAMHLFVFTSEILQAIRWRSKYNGCTQRI